MFSVRHINPDKAISQADRCWAPNCEEWGLNEMRFDHSSNCGYCGGQISLCDKHWEEFRAKLRNLIVDPVIGVHHMANRPEDATGFAPSPLTRRTP